MTRSRPTFSGYFASKGDAIKIVESFCEGSTRNLYLSCRETGCEVEEFRFTSKKLLFETIDNMRNFDEKQGWNIRELGELS